jgi:hypothetical protein
VKFTIPRTVFLTKLCSMYNVDKVNFIVMELTYLISHKFVVLCARMLFVSAYTGKLRFSFLGTETFRRCKFF